MTYFLRFPDESAWTAAATEAGFIVDDALAAYTHDRAIDVIGTISRGGEWDEEGNCLVPPTTVDGWHLNYKGDLPDGWEEYAVYPANPVRVWA